MSKIGWNFLEENDIYLYKIKNYNDEYNGKYLIFIKAKVVDFDTNDIKEYVSNYPMFRVKMTKTKKKPTTIEDIENAEYIKIYFKHYYERFLPYSGLEKVTDIKKRREKVKFYPDEYNYLYIYCFGLFIKIKDFKKEFEYFGNYLVSLPKKEYIPFGDNFYLLSVDKVINSFKFYNNKELKDIFTKEGQEIVEKNAKEFIELIEQWFKDNNLY